MLCGVREEKKELVRGSRRAEPGKVGKQGGILGPNTQRAHIREPTSSKINIFPIIRLRLRRNLVLNITGNRSILVPRCGENVAEASTGTVPGLFGLEVDQSAHGQEVGACGGEDGVELGFFAISREAGGAHAFVAGGFEDCDAAEAEEADEVADAFCVGFRDAVGWWVS